MRAGEALKTRILRQAEGDMVTRSQLLQLRHDAVRNVGDALGKQTVHQRLHDIQLVLQREIDEVCIEQDAEWGSQSGIISTPQNRARDKLEEHC